LSDGNTGNNTYLLHRAEFFLRS